MEVCNVLLNSDVHCFEKHPNDEVSSKTDPDDDVVDVTSLSALDVVEKKN